MRLATVFSGIGAIEYALDRLKINTEIIFACDNGGVDIFKSKIGSNLKDIKGRIKELEIMAHRLEQNQEENNEYLYSIEEHIDQVNNLIVDIKDSVLLYNLEERIDVDAIQYINDTLLSEKIITKEEEISMENQEIRVPVLTLLKIDDIKSKLDFSKDIISILLDGRYREYKSQFREAIEQINMADQKIRTLNILEELKGIQDYRQKKAYVDRLYEAKKKSNFVRKTYFANYNITDDRYHWNVTFLDGTQYREEVDLFVGGSPCQSFSMVGKQRGLNDTRGTLFYEYARLVDEIQPKIFIYENVKAILTNDEGNTWKTMQQVFNDLGYVWDMRQLNAKEFEIPQHRERVFVVGIRNDISEKRRIQKEDIFNALQKPGLSNKMQDLLEKDVSDKYFLSDKVREYVLATGTGNFVSRPQTDLEIARPLLTTMHKMHRAGVDNYVTEKDRLRKLTPRECLRLMGYGDEFKIVVSDTQIYQQAGNSIVVNVLEAIVRSLMAIVPDIFE